jgi:hypothetical protein
MKRRRLNTIINILSLATFIISTISGLVLWLALPDGYGYMGGRGDLIRQHIWGMSRPEWLDLHNLSSLIFVGLVIIHIALHWKWFLNLPRHLR